MIPSLLISKDGLIPPKREFYLRRYFSGIVLTLFVVGMVCAIPNSVLSGPMSSGNHSSPSPAIVKHIAKETEFNTVTLTEEAEFRLGIETASIERKKILKTHLYGGELILPLTPDHAAKPSASLGGKQSVSTILPLMTPADQIRVAEAQVNADGEVEVAKVQVEASRIAFVRAQRLLRDHAGSRKDLDQALAQLRLAQAALVKAQARRRLLGPALLATAPPEQFWVRVSVFVGALEKIDLKELAKVGSLTNIDISQQPGFLAKPVIGPPSSNPDASTIDLFYQIDHPSKDWQLGQKVGVALPLKIAQEGLTIPWSAVVIDIYGGTWVYEKTDLHTFVRRRVQVLYVLESDAMLASGPELGTKIVAQGAAELFGTEVGFGN